MATTVTTPKPPPGADLPPGDPEDVVYGYQMTHGKEPYDAAPTFPACIVQKPWAQDKVFRWLSFPQLKRHGHRGWTLYSPDTKEKGQIDRGEGGTPPGVMVDESNYVRWWEDAVMGWMPKRLWAQYQARTAERTRGITEAAMRPTLGREAERIGTKSQFSVKQWTERGEIGSDADA